MDIEVIASTAGRVADDLMLRGIGPDQRVTVMIEPAEPEDWITEVRRFARPLVLAEGWSDADIDCIIEEERQAVHDDLKGRS
jgi:hypothetical protein